MSRYKPTGWIREGYRHSLAARGVSTKRYAMADVIRNSRKGQRSPGWLAAMHAKGFKNSDLGIPTTRDRKGDVPREPVMLGDQLVIPGQGQQIQAYRGG